MSKDKGSKNNKKAPAVAKGKVSDYKSESKSKFAPLEITPLKTGGKPKN